MSRQGLQQDVTNFNAFVSAFEKGGKAAVVSSWRRLRQESQWIGSGRQATAEFWRCANGPSAAPAAQSILPQPQRLLIFLLQQGHAVAAVAVAHEALLKSYKKVYWKSGVAHFPSQYVGLCDHPGGAQWEMNFGPSRVGDSLRIFGVRWWRLWWAMGQTG